MKMPTVTIVIPCFNAEDTLEKAVTSVLRDPDNNIEIFILDDGSTDRTYEIAQSLAESDRRIRVEHQNNRGVSATRNKGIALSKGELIAFLDADDYFLGDCLSKRIDTLLANDSEKLAGAFCPAIMVNAEGKQLFKRALFDYKLPGNRLSYTSTFSSAFNPSCAVVKKEKLIASGGFNESLTGGEDYELWHRLMRNGDYFVKTENCFVAWTQITSSTVRSNTLSHYRQCAKVFSDIISDSRNVDLTDQDVAVTARKTQTRRTLGAAVTLAIAGDMVTADTIFHDIDTAHLRHCKPEELIITIKFAALRYLCRPEEEWNEIWSEIREPVIGLLKMNTSSNTTEYARLNEALSKLEINTHRNTHND